VGYVKSPSLKREGFFVFVVGKKQNFVSLKLVICKNDSNIAARLKRNGTFLGSSAG
jgi:hypothetical protein